MNHGCYIRLLIHALLEEWVQVSCIISLKYYQDLLFYSLIRSLMRLAQSQSKEEKESVRFLCPECFFFSCEKYSVMAVMFCLFIFNTKKTTITIFLILQITFFSHRSLLPGNMRYSSSTTLTPPCCYLLNCPHSTINFL